MKPDTLRQKLLHPLMNLQALSELCGVPTRTLRRIKSGWTLEPKPETVERIRPHIAAARVGRRSAER